MPEILPLAPMLFTLSKEPFNDHDWLYELKHDGYRIQAHVINKVVTLYSRNLKNFTKNFPSIAKALNKISHNVILDGEVIALDEAGHETWDLLRTSGPVKVIYMVFDILYLNDHWVLGLTLEQRRTLLKQVIPESEELKITEAYDDGIKLFDFVKKEGLEGIVAKKRDSKYQPGKRSSSWLKIPYVFTENFLIGGWTETESHRLASLLIGYVKNKQFVYSGTIGTGFKEKDIVELKDKLLPLEVEYRNGVHWVKPQLVVSAKYKTWTTGGKLRRPVVYAGLQPKVKPADVKPPTA